MAVILAGTVTLASPGPPRVLEIYDPTTDTNIPFPDVAQNHYDVAKKAMDNGKSVDVSYTLPPPANSITSISENP